MEEEGDLIVATLTIIQNTLTLELNLSTHILTMLVQSAKVLGCMVVLLDMVVEHLPLDSTEGQGWGGVISRTSHGRLPQVQVTWQQGSVSHLFLH